MAGSEPAKQAVVVCAHIDHLGKGGGGSLAKSGEESMIHFGADDNASGVAAMLEVAEYLASQRRNDKINMQRDVIFAAWSGEELGLHGSKFFVDELLKKNRTDQMSKNFDADAVAAAHDSLTVEGVAKMVRDLPRNYDKMPPADIRSAAGELKLITQLMKGAVTAYDAEIANATGDSEKLLQLLTKKKQLTSTLTKADEVLEKAANDPNVATEETKKATPTIYPEVAACLNMDMVGRMQEKLVLQGLGSSNYWTGAIESRNAIVGLPITLSDDTDLPTDATSFYQGGVPILSAFTGSHSDYHTPRDTPEKLNYPDAARIARLMGMITRGLVTSDSIPEYRLNETKKQMSRGVARAFLGTVPDYGSEVVGVLLSGVSKNAPAEKAGLKSGDVIVELAGRKIENIYDYTYSIEALKVGQETTIIVKRDGKELKLNITPGSRD